MALQGFRGSSQNLGCFGSAYAKGLGSRNRETHRRFTISPVRSSAESSYAQPANTISQGISQEEKDDFDSVLAEDKGKQIRTPWHRLGSDEPPASKDGTDETITKGKLLTTPSRMLKLILPLRRRNHSSRGNDVEPLALLVHPQQPLSYLERLIQSELPMLKEGDKERAPSVHFRAENSVRESQALSTETTKADPEEDEDRQVGDELREVDETRIDGKTERTGKLKQKSEASELRGGPGEGGVESYSGLGHEAPLTSDERNFVRWSTSTEMGDFIRDAARGREFLIEIEGAPNDIRVGVPSFSDRTHYLRMRLRKASRQLANMADVKRECDMAALKGAQRVAWAGLGILGGYWYAVYRLTFETDLGWDTMEPITYLVGLTGLIGGYGWFLYHNREVSYRAAMNITVSRRQSKLYLQNRFDLAKWEAMIDNANMLRKEIKAVANEYDVDWDEKADEQDDKVVEVLKKNRGRKDDEEKDEENKESSKRKDD